MRRRKIRKFADRQANKQRKEQFKNWGHSNPLWIVGGAGQYSSIHNMPHSLIWDKYGSIFCCSKQKFAIKPHWFYHHLWLHSFWRQRVLKSKNVVSKFNNVCKPIEELLNDGCIAFEKLFNDGCIAFEKFLNEEALVVCSLKNWTVRKFYNF